MADIKEIAYTSLYKVFGESLSYFYPDSFKRLPAVSYYEIYEKGFLWAEDKQYMTQSEIMVDLWGRISSQIFDMGIIADNAMAAAGFVKLNAVEIYDKDAGVYHRAQKYRRWTGVD